MTQLLEHSIKRQRKRWTKEEFYLAVDRGVITDKRIYLHHGDLIQMPAMGSLHARGVTRVNRWAFETFNPAFAIRCQCPFEMPDDSVPEPEFAVVTHEQDARLPHPNQAMLIVEVADSSIELDQDMAFDYAAAGVPEYWIVNVRDRSVEVFREPTSDSGSPLGHRYQWHQIFRDTESISPLARPGESVRVSRFVTMS